jgi:exodeoxyribonuclease V alpha subunit
VIPDLRQLVAAGVLAPLDAEFAEAIGRLAGEADPLALLGAAVARALTGRGHVCADLGALGDRPIAGWEGEGLALGRWPGAGAWRDRLAASALVARGGEAAPLVLEGSLLYLRRVAETEARLARHVRARTAAPIERIDRALLAAGLEREWGREEVADRARLAAERAVERRLSVITGGPGTGKTTALARCLALVAEQIRAVEGRPARLALAAPTGKAAARMAAAIGAARRGERAPALRCPPEIRADIPEEASTLHRLLGWGRRPGRRFAFGARRRLPFDAVAVDEASMADLDLMTALFDATPAAARLILVGDRHQLASVQAGAVLADLCAAGDGGRWITELDRGWRFGGAEAIGEAARLVNAGSSSALLAALARSAGDAAVSLLSCATVREACAVVADRAAAQFDRVVRERDPARRLAALLAAGALCAHRNGPLGSVHLNREIERRLDALGRRDPGDPWYDGRPVIALRNSPDAGLYNGDLGVACRDRATGSIEVWFAAPGGGVRAFAPGRIGEHETAFAVTVHKAQGSEFDEVVVVLPQAPSPITTRELLYTALTRARRRVEIIGPPEVVVAAVETPTVRASGLAGRIAGA